MSREKRAANRDPVRAAIGLRAHSGWAVLVAVAGTPREAVILERRRLVLAGPADPNGRQPYHAAEKLPFARGEQLIGQCLESSTALARDAVREAVDDLVSRGCRVEAVGLLLASGRALPDLAAVLASHALIHTAEGEMFREVLAKAAADHGLRLIKIRERELAEKAAVEWGLPGAELQSRLAAIGKQIGPPWRQDEKLAALAGWLALGSAERQKA